jgi:hypothetical protein
MGRRPLPDELKLTYTIAFRAGGGTYRKFKEIGAEVTRNLIDKHTVKGDK